MKRNLFNLIAVAVLLIAAAVACGKNKSVTDVTLNFSTLELTTGDEQSLRATVRPSDADNQNVSWTSSNPSVASVDKGLVRAIREGTATITVTTEDGGHQAKCEVTVTSVPRPPVIEMVSVEGGVFTMGCTDGDCWKDGREEPAHKVQLSDFQIAKYPVTQKEWFAIMRDNPSEFQGDNLPVETITYSDIEDFIERLNAATGKKYRLPTEAEWEYAARGGNKTKNTRYSGSNDINDVAWYIGNSGRKTHPVGLKKANELGIHDMSGNVWEWCSDFYGPYTDTIPLQVNPTGPEIGAFHVARGGSFIDGISWEEGARLCRVSARYESKEIPRSNHLGFRLAHD